MSTKITIVDEHDSIIGYKDRENLEKGDIYRISALWITNDKGEILLAKRSSSKSHNPQKWGPAVAGTVDKGENYRVNILKEAEEEIGLANINPQIGPKERISGKHNHFTQWYLVTVNKSLSEFTVNCKEVDEIKWFSKEDLLKEIKSEPTKFLKEMKQWIELFCG